MMSEDEEFWHTGGVDDAQQMSTMLHFTEPKAEEEKAEEGTEYNAEGTILSFSENSMAID